MKEKIVLVLGVILLVNGCLQYENKTNDPKCEIDTNVKLEFENISDRIVDYSNLATTKLGETCSYNLEKVIDIKLDNGASNAQISNIVEVNSDIYSMVTYNSLINDDTLFDTIIIYKNAEAVMCVGINVECDEKILKQYGNIKTEKIDIDYGDTLVSLGNVVVLNDKIYFTLPDISLKDKIVPGGRTYHLYYFDVNNFEIKMLMKDLESEIGTYEKNICIIV